MYWRALLTKVTAPFLSCGIAPRHSAIFPAHRAAVAVSTWSIETIAIPDAPSLRMLRLMVVLHSASRGDRELDSVRYSLIPHFPEKARYWVGADRPRRKRSRTGGLMAGAVAPAAPGTPRPQRVLGV